MIENPNVICNDCGFGKKNTELAIETKKVYERRRRLNHAERILKELAYGYQSRNQYNKLIAKANGYFKEIEK